MERKLILFGAGDYGRKALRHYGNDQVAYFADNNASLVGQSIEGIPVISFEQMKEVHGTYRVVLCVGRHLLYAMAAQLEEAGILDYEIFLKVIAEKIDQTVPDVPPPRGNGGAEAGEKRVLMVAYWFPPLGGSGVFRSTKFAKYLPSFGWRPTVISTDRPPCGWSFEDQSLLKEISKQTEVIRIPDLFHSLRDSNSLNAKGLFKRKDELLAFLREILQSDEDTSQIFTALSQTGAGAAELMTFPCGALSWAYDVVRYVEKELDISQFQAVYTTASPYSAHLVGFWLKKKYGIPWVADYRDPWTKSPLENLDYSRPRDQLFACLEAFLLREADQNIIVVEESIQEYIDDFHLSEGKITAITNGYDKADFDGLDLSWRHNEYFIINYAGVLSVFRRVDAVLEALRQLRDEGKIDLDKVRFRIVGKSHVYQPSVLAQKYGLGSIMIETGQLSHKDALSTNLNSSILLHMVGDDPALKESIGGKLYDYLYSGRPILALAPKDGVVDHMLRETGHGKAFTSAQIPEIKEMILQEYLRWQSGELREPLHSPLIEKYERKYLTRKLAKILDGVLSEE